MLGVSGLASIIARSRPTSSDRTTSSPTYPVTSDSGLPTSDFSLDFALRTLGLFDSPNTLCYVFGLRELLESALVRRPVGRSDWPEPRDLVRVAVVLASCRRGLGTEFSTAAATRPKRLFSVPEEALLFLTTWTKPDSA